MPTTTKKLMPGLPAMATVVTGWLLLASTACTAPAPQASLYQRLGGWDAITTMVDDGIGYISADPRINQRFAGVGGDALKRNLAEFLCERSGGPCVYKGRNMADAHEGMFVRDDEFDALVEDLGKAMDKARIGPRERAEVAAMLAKLRNSITGH
ncbi:MAG TPA: group 1 truncated hemoglobin [Burkholderiaceae bacterium]|nr:group 1 truncated hemoglobin [Burkholderiaceae bacterium]